MKKAFWILFPLVIIYFTAVYWYKNPSTNLTFDFNELEKIPLKVDKNFLWGSATSSYQVEGNCTNSNWNLFENSVDGNGKPRIFENQKSGKASDQWNRYADDIRLMKKLGLNAYRFSVEWSKIEPEEGKFDEKVLDHYEKMVDELLACKIEPMITLHHFTNPIWFENRGAFVPENSPKIFARYAAKVFQRLGKKIKLWCTINEPTVYAFNGYFFGEFPPGEKDMKKAAVVFRNLMIAHTEVYLAIKRLDVDAQVGLATAVYAFDPASRWNLMDEIAAYYSNKNMNEALLYYLKNGDFDFYYPFLASEKYESETMNTFDFIGVNYYTRFKIHFNPFNNQLFSNQQDYSSDKITDMGWEIYPEGLYRVLKTVSSFSTNKPIYITENGIADDSDTKREKFIKDHLLVMNKAISEGIYIKGYFYWSLIDNFEWAKGFSKKFGLYQVNFNTQERSLRKGSLAYPEMIKSFKNF
jgi:beta-glucosidase